MSITEKQKLLKKIFWDISTSGETLYSILMEEEAPGYLNKEKIFVRMIERLGWHDILQILGAERVKSLLAKETISKLRHPELRERYEFIRKILLGETVSFSGWGDEYYQKIKHTLFSDRWYRSQSALL